MFIRFCGKNIWSALILKGGSKIGDEFNKKVEANVRKKSVGFHRIMENGI